MWQEVPCPGEEGGFSKGAPVEEMLGDVPRNNNI